MSGMHSTGSPERVQVRQHRLPDVMLRTKNGWILRSKCCDTSAWFEDGGDYPMVC